MKRSTTRWMLVLLVFTLLMGVFTTASAAPKEGLDFFVDLYGWMPNLYADSASGSESEIDLDTILDDLQFMVMAIVGVQKDKWTFQADVIYMDLEDDTSSTKNLPHLPGRPGRSVNVNTDIELKAWAVTPTVSYNVLEKDKFKLDLLAGARYFYLDADLQVNLDGVRDHELSDSDSGSVWDAIVGVRGEIMLSEKWFMPYYADVGTGESDLTFNLFGGFGYRFSRVDLMAGWRYLRWNFDDNPVLDNLYINGPIAGLKIRF